MPSRLQLFCYRLLEAGWLAALVVVPLHFNPSTSRIFEADKIALLRSIAVVMAVAWLVIVVERWQKGGVSTRAPQRAGRHPVVVLAWLFLVSYGVATAFSILPRVSLWGYYGRLYGLYTASAFLVIFLSMVARVRTPAQVHRLVVTVVLVSLSMALYGVFQRFDIDPLVWNRPVAERVQSTLGNPVFLGAALGLAVPLTLYRLVYPASRSRWRWAGYGGLLVLQLACLFFTQSRGPVLGLMTGLLFGGLLWALVRQRWRIARGLSGVSLGLVLLLALINLPGQAEAPALGRLVRLSDAEGSAQSRLYLWEGAVALMAAEPKRLAVGYGPETTRFAFFPYYSAELGRIHGWQGLPDRMHNEGFDALVTTGLPGLLVFLLLISALVFYGLRGAGLMTTSGEHAAFLVLWTGGGIGAVMGGWLAGLGWSLGGAALGAGLLGGLFVYLTAYAWRAPRRVAGPPAMPRWIRALVVALMAGLVAYLVETSVGLAVGATRLLFWVYAALLVASGFFQRDPPGIAAPASTARRKKPKKGAASLQGGTLASMSLVVGLLLATLAYGLIMPEVVTGVLPGAVLLAAAWLAGGLLVFFELGASSRSWKAVATYAGLSLLPLAVLLALPTLGVWAGVALIPAYYGVVLLLVGGIAWGLGPAVSPEAARPSAAGVGLGVVGGLAALAFIYATNVQIIQANAHHQQARGAFEERRYDEAADRYRRALALDPRQELYRLELAQLLAAQAHSRASAAEGEALFETAESLLLEAAAENPFEQYHRAALGEVYRLWAGKTPGASERAARYRQALEAFGEAVRINADNVIVWHQWGKTYEEAGNRPQALETYRNALARDTTYTETYRRLGRLYHTEERWGEAAAMYQGALRHSPRPLPEMRVALADVYRAQGRLDRAAEQAEAALRLAPDEPLHHEMLIRIEQQRGRCADALARTRAALRRWPGNRWLTAQARSLAEECAEGGAGEPESRRAGEGEN